MRKNKQNKKRDQRNSLLDFRADPYVFEKKHFIHNYISSHFKFLFSNESLDLCNLKKK